MDYKTYIKSEKWREFSRQARVAAGLKCQICGAKNKMLHTHHLHYRTLGQESLSDVQVVCVDCHAGADRKREWNDGFSTYSRKRYGDDYAPSISEMNRREQEFNDWLDDKNDYR